MTKTIENARPQFVTSTLELYDELFTIHQLPQAQEDLDRVHKLVMLTDDERFPNFDKQTWWETYKNLKIVLTSFQTRQEPDTIWEVEIQL